MSIEAKAGQPFTLELGSAPSTGYMWELAAPPSGVKLLGMRFLIAPDAAIGDGGTQVFELQADQPGPLQLHFVLKRRWETTLAQEREIEVMVS
ncbi:protease inhibitor I42 family protein [Paucibacter sp. APW11]|uniref:Protease inhibitor I42 family protein n=1 Tax=Roseateles aquae TaxID=3077235 RepID=A0ABU3PGR9_9BURK|nr:protease inhibitor I42 family protein [Paucibacter sp. APW11]MDT9001580.1 protease inhibitor I42 family protein [Paucibacter sp. APW11]